MSFGPVSFTPTSSKHKGQLCGGAEIIITDRNAVEPYFAGIQIVETIYRMYPDKFQWRQRHFDRLCGTASVREAIIEEESLKNLKAGWQRDLKKFAQIRQKYLIYGSN
jgi:uncharacterized protein YbbC (DUF1343 family)